MIRDTFEANPGLCELFKRKIIERARVVGLNRDLIDFDGKIDLKGSYHDNLRIFYREYPALSNGSDYLRLKPLRVLGGAALEESWQSYVQGNGYESQRWVEAPNELLLRSQGLMPELTITYNFGSTPSAGQEREVTDFQSTSPNAVFSQDPHVPAGLTHKELVKLILDHVTEMAGDKVTKAILHHIGQEIRRTATHQPKTRIASDHLTQIADDVT